MAGRGGRLGKHPVDSFLYLVSGQKEAKIIAGLKSLPMTIGTVLDGRRNIARNYA